jgi:hypothetical protein
LRAGTVLNAAKIVLDRTLVTRYGPATYLV